MTNRTDDETKKKYRLIPFLLFFFLNEALTCREKKLPFHEPTPRKTLAHTHTCLSAASDCDAAMKEG